MTDALFSGCIVHPDRYAPKWNMSPSGTDEDLHLKLVLAAQQFQVSQFPNRIQPVPRLGILQALAGDEPKEEVGEIICKRVFGRHIFSLEVPSADQKRIRIPTYFFDKQGKVFGVMLTVGIDGDDIAVPQLVCPVESRSYACAFAHIDGVGDDIYVGITGPEKLARAVCGAVIDDKDRVALDSQTIQYSGKLPDVIVGRNGYDDFFVHRGLEKGDSELIVGD